jgi:hypothetical protein
VNVTLAHGLSGFRNTKNSIFETCLDKRVSGVYNDKSDLCFYKVERASRLSISYLQGYVKNKSSKGIFSNDLFRLVVKK